MTSEVALPRTEVHDFQEADACFESFAGRMDELEMEH